MNKGHKVYTICTKIACEIGFPNNIFAVHAEILHASHSNCEGMLYNSNINLFDNFYKSLILKKSFSKSLKF